MSTAQEAHELKQQGAEEASRDPNSSVTADDAQRKIIEESRKVGVAAFNFDPDATPEEKRAQAKAVGHPSDAALALETNLWLGYPRQLSQPQETEGLRHCYRHR